MVKGKGVGGLLGQGRSQGMSMMAPATRLRKNDLINAMRVTSTLSSTTCASTSSFTFPSSISSTSSSSPSFTSLPRPLRPILLPQHRPLQLLHLCLVTSAFLAAFSTLPHPSPHAPPSPRYATPPPLPPASFTFPSALNLAACCAPNELESLRSSPSSLARSSNWSGDAPCSLPFPFPSFTTSTTSSGSSFTTTADFLAAWRSWGCKGRGGS